MKKFLLSLGILMASGAAVAISSASSYSYHLAQYPYYNQYYPNLKVYRPSTNRVAPYYYKNRSNGKITCYQGDPCYDVALQSRDNTNSTQATQSQRPGSVRNRVSAYRATHSGANPRYPNTYQSQRLYVREGDYRERGVSYMGEGANSQSVGFSEEANFELNVGDFKSDGSGVYRRNGSSLAFRVIESPSTYRCEQSNFWGCAENLNKQFRETQNLGSIFNLDNEFRWNQTNGLDFDYYPTLTETFDGLKGSKQHSYFIFNALNPNDGSVTRVEGVTDSVNKAASAEEMYEIMESFQFKN